MLFEHICIEGNIGVGKTTLVKELSRAMSATPFFEAFEESELLPLFYEDPARYALPLETWFLEARSKQLQQVKKESQGKLLMSNYCLDKCLLFAEVNLTDTDLEAFKISHKKETLRAGKPSLVIVLHTSTESLMQNIASRGRPYEQNIKPDYLHRLNQLYRSYFREERDYPVLNIFTETLHEDAYKRITGEILTFLKFKPSFKNTNLEI